MKRYLLFIFIIGLLLITGCSNKYETIAKTSVAQNDLIFFDQTLSFNTGSILPIDKPILGYLNTKYTPREYRDIYPKSFHLLLYGETGIAKGTYSGFSIYYKKSQGNYSVDFGLQPDPSLIIQRSYEGIAKGESIGTAYELASIDKLPFFYFKWIPKAYDANSISKGRMKIAILSSLKNKHSTKAFLTYASNVLSQKSLTRLLNTLSRYGYTIALNEVVSPERLKEFEKEKAKALLKKRLKTFSRKLSIGCDNWSWHGEIDKAGYPKGSGTFYCSKAIGRYGLFFSRIMYISIQTTMHKLSMSPGSATVRIDGGVYQNTIHFNTPADIRQLVQEANRYYEAYVDRKNSRGSSSVSTCDAIYHTCTSYCGGKSTNSPAFSLSASDKEECKNKCFLGKLNCEHGDTLMWKVNTCNGICRGYSQKSGVLPFSTSSFERCVESCKADLFRGK